MNVCRTCGEMTRSSYASHLYKDAKNTLLHHIEAVTGLWLAFSEDIPVYVCAYCTRDINQAIRFRERCIKLQNIYQERHDQLQQRRKLCNSENQQKVIESDPLILEEIETLFEENEALEMENERITKEEIDVSDLKLNCEQNEGKDDISQTELETNYNNHDKLPDLDIIVKGTSNAKSILEICSPATLKENFIENSVKKTKPMTTRQRKSAARNTNCNICGKHFENVMSLKEHKLLHNIKKFQCNQCSKEFLKNRHLKEHLLRHTDMRPYSCRICDETFRSRSHRNKHEIRHTNPPTYNSNLCEKQFDSTDSRDQNEASHQGAGKYHCITCDHTFMFRHRLITHYKSKSHLSKVEALRLKNDENIT